MRSTGNIKINSSGYKSSPSFNPVLPGADLKDGSYLDPSPEGKETPSAMPCKASCRQNNTLLPGEAIIAPEAPSRINRPGDLSPSLDHTMNKWAEPGITLFSGLPPIPPDNENGRSKGGPVRPSLKRCPTPSGIFVHRDGRVRDAPCGSWDCPFCGPKKKMKLLARVERGGNIGGYRWRSLTTTQHPLDPMPITEAWARFRHLLAKVGFKHIKFFWTKEFTVRGVRHLHCVLNAYIPHAVLKACWRKATNGISYIVDIRSCNNVRKIAGYMSKYVTKSMMRERRFAKNERRYAFSQWFGWKSLDAPHEPGWIHVYNPKIYYDDGPFSTQMNADDKADEALLKALEDVRKEKVAASVRETYHLLRNTSLRTKARVNKNLNYYLVS